MKIPPISNANSYHLNSNNDPNQCWGQVIGNLGTLIKGLPTDPSKDPDGTNQIQGYYFALVTVSKSVGGQFQTDLQTFKNDYKDYQDNKPGALAAMSHDVNVLMGSAKSIHLSAAQFKDLYLNGTPPSKNSLQYYFQSYFKASASPDTYEHLEGFVAAFAPMAKAFASDKFNQDLNKILNSPDYASYVSGNPSSWLNLQNSVKALNADF